MRIPEPGPFGDTFLDARVRAIVGALFLNSPAGGYVDSVFTLPDHRLAPLILPAPRFRAILFLHKGLLTVNGSKSQAAIRGIP
jgi:hypothetical protein